MTILNLTTLKTPKDLNLIGKQSILIAIVMCCFIACNDVQERKIPERILSEDEMVEIYTDMMILDAIKRSNTKIYNAYNLKAHQHIFNKYKIDSTLLNDNIDYYNLEFEANIRIFERVNEKVNQKKAYFDSINKVLDSVEKIKLDTKKDSIKTIIKPQLNKSFNPNQLND